MERVVCPATFQAFAGIPLITPPLLPNAIPLLPFRLLHRGTLEIGPQLMHQVAYLVLCERLDCGVQRRVIQGQHFARIIVVDGGLVDEPFQPAAQVFGGLFSSVAVASPDQGDNAGDFPLVDGSFTGGFQVGFELFVDHGKDIHLNCQSGRAVFFCVVAQHVSVGRVKGRRATFAAVLAFRQNQNS